MKRIKLIHCVCFICFQQKNMFKITQDYGSEKIQTLIWIYPRHSETVFSHCVRLRKSVMDCEEIGFFQGNSTTWSNVGNGEYLERNEILPYSPAFCSFECMLML